MGPSRSVAERPGWNQAGASRVSCALRGVEAELGQQREHIGLGVEQVGRLGRRRPSGGPQPVSAAAPARTPDGGDELVLGRVAAIGLAHLEQRRRRRSRGCGCAARPPAGPAAGSAASTSSRSRSGWRAPAHPAPPPKRLRRRRADERPGDGLDQPAAGERAPRAAHALLALGQHGAGDAADARHRRRRHLVEAGDAHDLLDEIGGAVDVGPPARRRHLDGRALALDGEAQRLQRGADLLLRAARCPPSFSTRPRSKVDDRLGRRAARRRPCAFDGVPPATSSIMAVARSRPGRMKAGSTPRSKR